MRKILALIMAVCMILFFVITATYAIQSDPLIVNTGQQTIITNLVGDSAKSFVPSEVVYDTVTKVVPALSVMPIIQDNSIIAPQFNPMEVAYVSIAEIFSAIPILLTVTLIMLLLITLISNLGLKKTTGFCGLARAI